MAVQNTDLSNKVVSAYKSALTRGPSQQELTAALEILNRSVRPGRNDADLSKSWEVFCEGLLKSDPISFEE
jgi:hypothetical protein